MRQERYKSWALWLSVAGAVWTILSAFGIPEKIGVDKGMAKTVLDSIGSILIAFGILNDPTNKEGF